MKRVRAFTWVPPSHLEKEEEPARNYFSCGHPCLGSNEAKILISFFPAIKRKCKNPDVTLQSSGASFESKTIQDETLLHLAARCNSDKVAKRLLDYGADPNAKDRFHRTPIHLAIGANGEEVFKVKIGRDIMLGK